MLSIIRPLKTNQNYQKQTEHQQKWTNRNPHKKSNKQKQKHILKYSDPSSVNGYNLSPPTPL